MGWRKHLFTAWLGVMLTGLGPVASGNAAAGEKPRLTDAGRFQSALLQDARTGQILFVYRSDKVWPQASLTKMMLALVTFEEIESGRVDLESRLVVSRRASRTRGRTIGLRRGQTFPLGTLLRAVMVTSANDAAVAVAEGVFGSVAACVELMNARAAALGMHHSRYATVNGMPTRRNRAPDVASADDMAALARALLRHTDVLDWTSRRSMPFRAPGRRGVHLPNTNRLVGRTPGVDGLKTGFTNRARYNLVSTAQRGALRLVAIVFGGETSRIRFRVAKELIEWGFDNFTRLRLVERGAPLWAEVRVQSGSVSTVQPVAAASAAPLIRADEADRVAVSLRLPEQVAAPIRREQVLGGIVIHVGNRSVSTVPAVSPAAVPRARWAHARH